MIRSMLIVVQFSDGVTSVFHVSVLVDLKPVVVSGKVLAGVETGQVERHGQWSVSLMANKITNQTNAHNLSFYYCSSINSITVCTCSTCMHVFNINIKIANIHWIPFQFRSVVSNQIWISIIKYFQFLFQKLFYSLYFLPSGAFGMMSQNT